jgi:hypothetical protein
MKHHHSARVGHTACMCDQRDEQHTKATGDVAQRYALNNCTVGLPCACDDDQQQCRVPNCERKQCRWHKPR